MSAAQETPEVKAAPKAAFPEPITGIIGPPGSGKTHLAGMLIPEFRAAVKAKKPRADIFDAKDVVWLQADRAGSDTLLSYGVRPKVYDISTPPSSLASLDLFADAASSEVLASLSEARIKWLRRVSQILREIQASARAGETRLMVVDTMTALTKMLTDAFIMGEIIAQPSDKFNKIQQYGFANAAISNLTYLMRAIPCPTLWLLHGRSSYIDPTEKTATEDRLDLLARRQIPSKIEVDVQRGVQTFLESTPSMMFGARIQDEGGGQVSYHLITKPDGIYPVKNRWAARMPNGTEPDLQKVWDCIPKIDA